MWQELAACAGDRNPDWLADEMTLDCATTCLLCPVRLDCFTEALPRDRHWDAGIWGGTTLLQRDRIRSGKARLADVWAELERTVKEAHGGRSCDMDGTSSLLSRSGARP